MAGAAELVVSAAVSGAFNVLESTEVLGVDPAQVVGGNPDRVGLLFVNTGSDTVYLGFGAEVSATRGIPLQASGGSLVIDVREDFMLPVFPVWAVAPIGAPDLYIAQIVRETE